MKASQVAQLLKPYILQWINDATYLTSPIGPPAPGTGDATDDTHIIYAHADGSGTRSAYQAERLNKSILAGTGLSGGGILTADRTLNIAYSGTPSTIAPDDTAAGGSSGNPARTDHTHAIAAAAPSADSVHVGSSTEGVSTSFARADHAHNLDEAIVPTWVGIHYFNSDVVFDTDTLFVDVSEDAVYVNAGGTIPPTYRGALTVKSATTTQKTEVLQQITSQTAAIWSVLDSTGNDLIFLNNVGDLESGNPGFVSGLVGWQITHDGNAEFWNVVVRGELHVSVFVADEMHASGGTIAVLTATKITESVITGDNVTVALDTNFTLNVQASWDTGLCYFAVDDVIRLKFMTEIAAGGSLDLYDIYLEVEAVGSQTGRDLSNGKPGYYPLTVKRRSGGVTGITIPTGTGCVKWGEVGGATDTYTGGLILTSDLSQSPYIDIFTVNADGTPAPWEAAAIKPRVRVGNLDGVLGLTEQWGIAAGKDLSDTSQAYVIMSDLQVGLFGVTQTWWDSGGNAVAQVVPTATGNDSLFWLGPSASDKKLEYNANGHLRMRGSISHGASTGYLTTAQFFCPFSGPTPAPTNFSVKLTTNDNEAPTANRAAIGRVGEYGKGVQVSPGTTNLIENSSFELAHVGGVPPGWTVIAGDATFTRHSASPTEIIDTYKLKMVAGTVATNLEEDTGYSVAAGETVTLSGWIRKDGETFNLILRDTTNSVNRITLNTATVDAWVFVYGSWTNDTGLAATVKVRVNTTTTNGTSICYFDALQLESSAYPTSYCNGGLGDGHSWAGTAYNSHSTRTNGLLTYATSGNITAATGTISFWFRPHWDSLNGPATAYLFDIRDGTDNFGYLLYDNSTGIFNFNGNTTAYSLTAHTDYHVAVTWNGTTKKLYVNGTLLIQPADDLGAVVPATLYIGRRYTATSWANGTFCDFMATNRALLADEIADIAASADPMIVPTSSFESIYDTIGEGRVWINASGLFAERADGKKSFALINTSLTNTWGGFTVAEGDLVLGDNVSGSSAIFWNRSAGTFGFYGDGSATVQVEIGTDGTLKAGGGNITLTATGMYGQHTDATKAFALALENSLSWGGLTIDIGDVVLGHNKTGSSAIWWDKSAGKLKFLGDGAATIQAYIDTDGSFVAGGGSVKFNSDGMAFSDIGLGGNYDTIQFFYKGSVGGTPYRLGYTVGDYGGGPGTLWHIAKRETGAPWSTTELILAATDDVAGTDVRITLSSAGTILTSADAAWGYLDMYEYSATNPSANRARLHCKDNGSGKTQLCVIFASGADIVLATEA